MKSGGMPGLWFARFRKYSKKAGLRLGYASDAPTNFVCGDTFRMGRNGRSGRL